MRRYKNFSIYQKGDKKYEKFKWGKTNVSNLYHRWYSNYWNNYGKSTSNTKDYDYYGYYGFDDLYDQYDDDKAGWENEEWYADWLEKEYGYDTVEVYYDCLWYDNLTPNEALNVALNYILDNDIVERNSETKYDEYTYCDDDVFYKHYDVEELLEDYNDVRFEHSIRFDGGMGVKITINIYKSI